MKAGRQGGRQDGSQASKQTSKQKKNKQKQNRGSSNFLYLCLFVRCPLSEKLLAVDPAQRSP